MLKIRAYHERDLEDVVALWRKVFPDPPPWNHPQTDIRRKLSVQKELFLVAHLDQELVGTAMAGYDGHRGWVYYVGVSPKHRRKGIGSALMEEVETRLAQMGCPKLNLQVRADNKAAVDFYKTLGFQVEDRVSMAKRL